MAVLAADSYGKSAVRLTKVARRGDVHELMELSVDVALEGGFARCYTHGDNSSIIATDTMKNTVYALAKQHPFDSIETFAQLLSAHFLDRFAHVTAAEVRIRQHPWQRLERSGLPHPHAFIGSNSERRSASIRRTRESCLLTSGLSELLVLKTTRSGFTGFIRDGYTTLRETTDRIFATSVTASWRCSSSPDNWNDHHAQIRSALLETFAEHDSLSVQQTLYAMGEAALAASDLLAEITLEMPNRHRLLVDLEPVGLQNDNEIFVPTDEPYGLITGTIRRD